MTIIPALRIRPNRSPEQSRQVFLFREMRYSNMLSNITSKSWTLPERILYNPEYFIILKRRPLS